MSEDPNIQPEPQSFADLANQPTGSGVADEQIAFMEAALEGATADTGVEDERVVDPDVLTPTVGGSAEDESEAQPS